MHRARPTTPRRSPTGACPAGAIGTRIEQGRAHRGGLLPRPSNHSPDPLPVIPRAYITQWRATAPWAETYQVEQDLVLWRAAIEIFSDPLLREALAFRGGTVLHKVHLQPAARYSEDLDFVQVRAGAIGPVLDAIRARLRPFLGDEPSRDRSDKMITLTYRFFSEDATPVPLKLKIEINGREHFSVDPLQQIPIAMESRWYTGSAFCQTYTLNELLGTKLRALYQRRKGRDLFDLSVALRHDHVDPAHVVHCFDTYMRREGHPVTRDMVLTNIANKRADEEFRADMEVLLAPGVLYDVDEAFSQVLDTLETHLLPVMGAPE